LKEFHSDEHGMPSQSEVTQVEVASSHVCPRADVGATNARV